MDDLALPPGVLKRMREDPTLAYHLEVCGTDSEMLSIFLGRLVGEEGTSNARLAASALRALGKWAVSGARTVTDIAYRRRVESCEKCPHSKPPSEVFLHRVAHLTGTSLVCSLCGCDVRRKARLPTEVCPDGAFGKHGRWGAINDE